MSETNDTGKGIGVADIRKMVTDMVGEAVKAITPATTTDKDKDTTRQPLSGGGKSVAEQVQEAIAGIKDKEARETREKTIDEKLKELDARTAEKPPVERRRVHKFMGWGE